MLVLTRKVGETILLDGGIELQVVKIKGNRIQLGIKAPEEITIRRGELTPHKESEAA